MCRNCGFKHKQHQTAAHVLDFQFFIIPAVDIFYCFCRAVAIRAVNIFLTKSETARIKLIPKD